MPVPSPFKYKYVFDYGSSLGTGNCTIANADEDFNKSQLPGVRIMRSLNQVRRNGDTARQLVEALYMVFTEQSRQLGWRWLPATTCRNARLVDGELAAAECGGFAAGMYCLACAPHPFGLGVKAGDGTADTVKVELYTGEKLHGKGPGFVSFHPPDEILGLPPNVHTAVGTQLPGRLRNQSFYLWADHKVVRFANHLFDPTYGCQYENLADMACLQIIGWEVLGEKAPPATLEAFENTGGVDSQGRHLYICQEPGTQTRYYIRMTPSSLQGSEKLYQGPFTQTQRDRLAQALAAQKSDSPPIGAATVFGYQ